MAATSAGSWAASPFRDAPACGLFPRTGFCVVPFAPGSAIYVFGGASGGRLLNDIWMLQFVAEGGMQWTEVSPNLDPKGSVAAGQTVVSSKWSARERLAAAVAPISRAGRLAMYVCGGLGKMNKMADFWASEDSGQNWYCMTQQLPCGGRVDPSLLAVPGRYEQLVLCCGVSAGEGGMQMHADIWVTADAGSTWAELPRPPPQMEPRAAPVATFLSGTAEGGAGRRLLILGGTCVGDEQEALLADAWEATLDIEARTAEWRQLGEPPEAPVGFNGHTAAFDHSALVGEVEAGGEEAASGGAPSPGAIVAVHDRELRLSPPTAPHSWTPCGLRDGDGGSLQLPGALKSPTCRICFLPALGSSAETQVVAVADQGAAAAGVQRAQLWLVVGGGDKGGIVVREGQDLASPELERLGTGSTIAELDLAGNRLHFRLLAGSGPPEGWVNVALKDKELVRRF